MMKIGKYLALPAVAMLMLSSCGDKKTESLADIKDATPGDSLMYYFGKNIAADYWDASKQDSSMVSEQARKDYLRGVEAGLAAARKSNAYNQGLYVGVQLAINIKDFRENFPEYNIDDKVLVSSLAAGLDGDGNIDVADVKADFYKYLEKASRQKREIDRKKAYDLLAGKAKDMGMNKVTEGLYGKVVAQGSGAVLKDGDRVKVDMSASTLDGQTIGMQFPEELVVGRNYSSPIVSEALRSMKPGETKQFIVSPIDLTPRRYSQGELRADSLLKFTIKVMTASPEEGASSMPYDGAKAGK